MQHDIDSATDIENVIASVGLEYIPVQENPQVIEDQPSVREDQPAVIEDQPHVADQFGQEDQAVPPAVVAQPDIRIRGPQSDTRIQVPHRHNTRLQQRRSTADHVLTTLGMPEKKVRISGSAVESITAFLEKRKREGTVDPSANVSVRQALRTRGDDAEKVIIKELTQMDVLDVWEGVRPNDMEAAERTGVIRSSMFLKRKTHPDGSFDKYKARLVAGGDMQDKKLYEDLSSPTVATSSVFTIAAIAAHEGRHVAVIGGAFLNAKMQKSVPVYMRLDKIMTEYLIRINPKYNEFRQRNGTITVLLKKALYGCVESASLWYQNLGQSLKGLGYIRNEVDICVYNKASKQGVQCTLCVHVDDLMITSKSKKMIAELTDGLLKRYGEITLRHGPMINYLGVSIDFSHSGEARLTMAGYVQQILDTSGVTGTARTPASDTLFDADES
jgi:Reverse transcriptase (RNA-dependent DNA polymerase)